MAVKKVVEEAVYEDLMAELLATVKVPADLPISVERGIVLKCPTKDQVESLGKAETEVDAQKIIFGDHFDEAMDLFSGMPLMVWNGFMEKYNKHFFGDADSGK
jgi:hypothetical protein